MTQTNNLKFQQSIRMGELEKLARQRYLDAGEDPHRATNGDKWMTTEEKQEYLTLARQVFDEESINNYIKKHGTWRDRFAAFKEKMKSVEE